MESRERDSSQGGYPRLFTPWVERCLGKEDIANMIVEHMLLESLIKSKEFASYALVLARPKYDQNIK